MFPEKKLKISNPSLYEQVIEVKLKQKKTTALKGHTFASDHVVLIEAFGN